MILGIRSKQDYNNIIFNSRLHGKDWHYKVAPIRDKNIIVSFEYVWKIKTSRKFVACESYDDLFTLVEHTSENYRNFYEIIKGEEYSKMRYDVDYVATSDEDYQYMRKEILYNILKAIIKVKNTRYIIYTSCSCPKVSYHIILPDIVGYSYQLEEFYRNTILSIDKDFKENMKNVFDQMFDSSIYKSLQNFRLLFCTKPGKNRYKKILSSFVYKDINYVFTSKGSIKLDFFESLSYYVTGDEEALTTEKKEKIYDIGNYPDVNAEMVLEYVSMIGSFTVTSVKGGLVILKKLSPYDCPVCNRTHESENPYAFVSINGDIYFDCRRSSNKRKLLLGNIDIEKDISEGIVVFKDLKDEIVKYKHDPKEKIMNLFVYA